MKNELEKDLRLRAVFENIIVGIIVLNEEGIIESVNKKALAILGFDEESELGGKRFRDFIIDTTIETYNQYTESFIDPLEVSQRELVELLMKRKDGENIPVEFTLTVPRVNDQHLYIGIIKDISEKKELKREIRGLEKEQQKIVKELDREQELNELKSRFVSMASHEFRTPLAGVLSSLNLIERYLKAEQETWEGFIHKPKIESHFGKIKESVKNLTEILNEFLSVGKLEEGKVQCKWETFDLKNMLQGVLSDLQRLCKPGQKINYIFEGIEDQVILDRSMIRIIINNLISNAIKYSPEDKEIILSAKVTARRIEINVTDHGIGIPEAEQNKLFSRFFRAKNVTNIQGTGLGLNIVKKYLELMGGNIHFKSELEKGTTFTISLPNRSE